MSNKCCIPGCKTSYWRANVSTSGLHLFSAITEKRRENWEKILRRKVGLEKFDKNDVICVLHFKEDVIERERNVFGSNGKYHKELRKQPLLSEYAEPTIFPEYAEKSKLPTKHKIQNNVDYSDTVDLEICNPQPKKMKIEASEDITSKDIGCDKTKKTNDLCGEIVNRKNEKVLASKNLNKCWITNLHDGGGVSLCVWKADCPDSEQRIVLHKNLKISFPSKCKEELQNKIFLKCETPEYDSVNEEVSQGTQNNLTNLSNEEDENSIKNKEDSSKTPEIKICDFQEGLKNNQSLENHRATDPGSEKTINRVQDEGSYKCQFCTKHFHTYRSLNAHMRIHADLLLFKCEVCHRRFSSEEDFKTHKFTHGINQFFCSVCNTVFSRKSSMEWHERSHYEKNTFECNICGKKMKYFRNLKKHIKLHKFYKNQNESPNFETISIDKQKTHSCDCKDRIEACTEVKSFKCQFCNDEFSDQNSLTSHMLIHETEGRFKCKICAKSYSIRHYFKLHMESHLEGKFFKCVICGERFLKISELATHRLTHKTNNPHVCPICSKTFLSLSSLKKHEKMHSDIGSFECEICEKKFRTSKQAKEHARSHTGEKRFECDLCMRKYHTRFLLKIHLKTHYNESGTYECQVCFAIFENIQDIENHVENHFECKAFSCEFCEESLFSASSFASHMLTHKEPELSLPHDHTYAASGEGYKCPFCLKRYTRSFYYHIHLPKHHKFEPIKCVICEELFTFKSHLKTHMKIHETKSFACDVCYKIFETMQHLINHKIKHLTWKARNENVKDISTSYPVDNFTGGNSTRNNSTEDSMDLLPIILNKNNLKTYERKKKVEAKPKKPDNDSIHHSMKEIEEVVTCIKTEPEDEVQNEQNRNLNELNALSESKDSNLFLRNQELSDPLYVESLIKLEDIKLEVE